MSTYLVKLTSDLTPDVCGLYRGRIVGIRNATAFDSPSAARKALEGWLASKPERAERWRGEVVPAASVLGDFKAAA